MPAVGLSSSRVRNSPAASSSGTWRSREYGSSWTEKFRATIVGGGQRRRRRRRRRRSRRITDHVRHLRHTAVGSGPLLSTGKFISTTRAVFEREERYFEKPRRRACTGRGRYWIRGIPRRVVCETGAGLETGRSGPELAGICSENFLFLWYIL